MRIGTSLIVRQCGSLATVKICIVSALLAVPLFLGGCERDFRRDGGLIGSTENTVVNAPNRQWQTYRAAMFLMLVSSAAEANLKDANSIASFYFAATAVKDDINNLAGHLYPQYYWYPWNWECSKGTSPALSNPDGGSPATSGGQPVQSCTGSGGAASSSTPTTLDWILISGTARPGPLLPCPSFRPVPADSDSGIVACAQAAAAQTIDPASRYRFRNYVGLFNADLPILNQHLFKAAAAAIRQDKFVKLVQDSSSSGALGGPLGISFGVLQDALDVFGEIAESEQYLAASWRSEADNSAAITSAGPPYFPDKYPSYASYPDCTGVASSATIVSPCARHVTTEDAIAAFKAFPATQQTDLPAAAFEPIYTAIRKSCAALSGKLGPSPSSQSSKGPPPPISQDTMVCSQFAFAPNVYRADYQGPLSPPPAQTSPQHQ